MVGTGVGGATCRWVAEGGAGGGGLMRDGVELRQFAERYTGAWCGGDGGGVAAHFCASGSLTINDGAAAVGRSAIAEAAQGFMSAFPDLRVAMDELRVVGERVEYHWTLTGTAAESGRLV